MQLINSTVIRELSTIIFFREIISGGLYLGGLYPGAYNGVLIFGAYIPGLTSGSLYPGAYIRGLIIGDL